MNTTPELTLSAIKMLLALALALAILWGVQRWARGRLSPARGSYKGRLIQVVGQHYLGMKKSITLVRVPGSVLVLGISADRINVLSRIEDPELLAQMDGSVESTKVSSFKEQLQRLTGSMQVGAAEARDERKQHV